MPETKPPFQIFIVYAREDREPLEALRKKLAPLLRSGRAEVWYDGEITGGKIWDAEIRQNLKAADIVLLLISDDFFESEYIDNVELREALDGHHRQENTVVPVILYDCLWTVHPELAQLQALPDEAKPVFHKKHWDEPTEALNNIARGIVRILEDADTQARRTRRRERFATEIAAADDTAFAAARTRADFEKYLAKGHTRHADAAQAKIDKFKKDEAAAAEKRRREAAEREEAERRKYLPELVRIPGGTFRMGSAEDDKDAEDPEKPAHEVRVSDFYLAKYQTTVAQFKAFVDATGYKTEAEQGDGSYAYDDKGEWGKQKGINWRHNCEGKPRPESEYNHPVIHVSWNDAQAYCSWLCKKTGDNYRLPTEAEWEYAAGNGAKHTKYSWGNQPPSGKNGGNVADESAKKRFPSWQIFEGYDDGYVFTAPVGSFVPNEFGLFDMTGNVWEWCQDWYDADYYKKSPSANPSGPDSGSYRVLRGGSWGNVPQVARVAYRSGGTPGYRSNGNGFRLARTL